MSIVNAIREGFKTNSRAKEHIDWELDHNKKPIRIIGGVGTVVAGMIMAPHLPVLLILAAGGIGGPLALKYGLKGLAHAGAFVKGFVTGLRSDGSQPEPIQKQAEVPEKPAAPSKVMKQKLVPNFQSVAPRQQQVVAPQMNAEKRFNPAGPMQWKG